MKRVIVLFSILLALFIVYYDLKSGAIPSKRLTGFNHGSGSSGYKPAI